MGEEKTDLSREAELSVQQRSGREKESHAG